MQETKTHASQARDGMHALEHRVGGVAEAVERLKKSLSAFQKCLHRLLTRNEEDESVVI